MSPELHARLLEATPPAPPELRDRVAAITAVPGPVTRSRVSFVGRRAALVAAAAAVAAILGAGVIGGIRGGSTTSVERAAPAVVEAADDAAPYSEAPKAPPLPRSADLRAPQPAAKSTTAGDAAAPGPTRTRAQDYNAALRLLVSDSADLSEATQRALRTTRRFGGYAVSVQYATPETGEGTAELLVRVPVTRVQAAIIQFNELGRILAQDVHISDLQQPLDELTRRIRRLERRSAQIRAQLANPNLAAVDRARLQNELAATREAIAQLRRERTEINRRASLATVSLALTTNEPEEPQAAPGRLDRAVDDAIGVLKAELAIVAYVLIVASPFLILLAAALLGRSAYRRHADQRLLERA